MSRRLKATGGIISNIFRLLSVQIMYRNVLNLMMTLFS